MKNDMRTAIVAIKNKSEETFLKTFFKKAGIRARIMKQFEIEDAIFAALIDEGMKTETVSEKSVLKALHTK
ncbi:MAG: hypothetical protein JST48_03095 [Bacteroidetes bacterium]|nr:hypothetical protein [Bacteroidota bacterium]